MDRSYASRVSSPRLKWVILLSWLVVVAAVSAPLAGGLTAEQDNEISAWLPGDAESTIALEQQAALGSDPDVIPAVVVHERTDGLTHCWTRSSCARCSSPRSPSTSAGGCGGPAP